MIKISQIIEKMVSSSEIVEPALAQGILNLSAYAKKIRSEVEKEVKKPVTLGSIVIALSRLKSKPGFRNKASLKPLKIKIQELALTMDLLELTFSKQSPEKSAGMAGILGSHDFSNSFFMVTQTSNEITFITKTENRQAILQYFKPRQPKVILENLGAFSIRFNKSYLKTPKLIFSLIRPLAVKNINIIEVISTYSEICFIFEKKDLEKAFTVLNEVLIDK